MKDKERKLETGQHPEIIVRSQVFLFAFPPFSQQPNRKCNTVKLSEIPFAGGVNGTGGVGYGARGTGIVKIY